MKWLKPLSQNWDYQRNIINGYEVCFRRHKISKEVYVEATNDLAKAMGCSSLTVMLNMNGTTNMDVLNSIYGKHRKWLLVDWVNEQCGRMHMGLKIAVPVTIHVTTE